MSFAAENSDKKLEKTDEANSLPSIPYHKNGSNNFNFKAECDAIDNQIFSDIHNQIFSLSGEWRELITFLGRSSSYSSSANFKIR